MATESQTEKAGLEGSHRCPRPLVCGLRQTCQNKVRWNPTIQKGPFESWAKSKNIIHELTSPYNHQSNEAAECAVRQMKKPLEKTDQNWHQFQVAQRDY